jgi:hypothetical protein
MCSRYVVSALPWFTRGDLPENSKYSSKVPCEVFLKLSEESAPEHPHLLPRYVVSEIRIGTQKKRTASRLENVGNSTSTTQDLIYRLIFLIYKGRKRFCYRT